MTLLADGPPPHARPLWHSRQAMATVAPLLLSLLLPAPFPSSSSSVACGLWPLQLCAVPFALCGPQTILYDIYTTCNLTVNTKSTVFPSTMDNQDWAYAQLPILDPNSVKALRNSIKRIIHCIKCGGLMGPLRVHEGSTGVAKRGMVVQTVRNSAYRISYFADFIIVS